MSAILKVLKAIYDFFAGDAILLAGVAIAFLAGALLARVAKAPTLVTVVVFVAVIVAAVAMSLARELPRKARRS